MNKEIQKGKRVLDQCWCTNGFHAASSALKKENEKASFCFLWKATRSFLYLFLYTLSKLLNGSKVNIPYSMAADLEEAATLFQSASLKKLLRAHLDLTKIISDRFRLHYTYLYAQPKTLLWKRFGPGSSVVRTIYNSHLKTETMRRLLNHRMRY